MRMRRQAGALILYGGWLLVFNPDANRPDAPLSSWKKRGEYDTGYLCEQRALLRRERAEYLYAGVALELLHSGVC